VIWNIVDRRKRRYRWKSVNAVVESVENDNACSDSDQAPIDAHIQSDYDERRAIPVLDAVTWAHALPNAVTLYLYDEGDGI